MTPSAYHARERRTRACTWTTPLHLRSPRAGPAARAGGGACGGCPIAAPCDGDAGVRGRPVHRFLEPLARIGAQAASAADGGRLPITLAGARDPIPIVYRTPVPSAQIKSAVLLAGLAAPGETTVIESEANRDHTERLLKHFGAQVRIEAVCAHRLQRSVPC